MVKLSWSLKCGSYLFNKSSCQTIARVGVRKKCCGNIFNSGVINILCKDD